MSAKIVPFPTQTENVLEEINSYIRAYLTEVTADRDFINDVSNRMEIFIEKYANKLFEPTLNLVVPPNLSREQADALLLSIDKGIANTAKEVQDMVSNIIFERLHLEIQIYASQKNIKHRLC